MPWTVKDVDKHKKGLTPAQKKKWVSIANSALKDCKAKSGKDCEGKAIRIANSKFSEEFIMTTKKIPNGALRLVQTDCHAFAEGEGDKKKLKMTIYSGKVIKDHWWWNNLAIDLEGGKFPLSRYPILENHNTDKRIAFTAKPLIDKEAGISVNSEKTEFLDNEESLRFQKDSAKGFPFQASMYAKPSSVERINEGEKAEVNGFTLRGPGTIWRKWEFKEASVCVFGWDSKTESSAFSRDAMTEIEFEEIGGDKHNNNNTQQLNDNNNNKEVKKVDIKTLSEEHPELLKKIQDDAVAEAKVQFDAENKILKDKLAEAEESNEALGVKVQTLEKKDLLRDERERKATANGIWERKLSDSNIAEHLFDKIKNHVNYSKFVKDDVFDTEAFTAAVDAEIEDWEKRGATTQVMGAGFTEKNSIDSEAQKSQKLDEENDGIAGNLLKLAGQTVA